MKKLFISTVAVAATFALTACVSEDQNLAPNEAGKGYIALNVTNDDALTTRTVQTVSDPSQWYVSVNDGITPFSGTVSELRTAAFSAGTGYTITASNYANLDAALDANNKLGDAYYEGTSSPFDVTAGQTANASVECGKAKNARLTIDATAFSAITIKSMTVSSTNRIVTFPITDATTSAYFAVDEALTFNIKYTAANGTEQEVSKPINALIAATDNKIKLSTNANGLIALTITYDNELTAGETTTYTFDAATGQEL